MNIDLSKAWLPLTPATVAGLPGHLGVFELADDSRTVIYIGAADGRSLFGLRSALSELLDLPDAAFFRYEVNMAYATRRKELLMVHHARHGRYPRHNDDREVERLGRLQPN